jgi:hypothetical protein
MAESDQDLFLARMSKCFAQYAKKKKKGSDQDQRNPATQ